MDYIGKSPVPITALIIAKLALFTCAVFPFIRYFNSTIAISPLTDLIGTILYGGGFLIIVIAIIQLGNSVAVGLPERPTELRSHGLYRFTRNPIYVGAYCLCFGSCLIALHPVNVIAFFIAMVIHHRIIRREEEFLEWRFGQRWVEYRQRVPRYIGYPGRNKPIGHLHKDIIP